MKVEIAPELSCGSILSSDKPCLDFVIVIILRKAQTWEGWGQISLFVLQSDSL